MTTEDVRAGAPVGADPDFRGYLHFTRERWARLAAATPLALSQADLDELTADDEPVSPAEVARIYLPLTRLLSLHVSSTQTLRRATNRFLGTPDAAAPFVIGVAGSVAVGKSTTARVLRALLALWPAHPEVDLVTTDGFLLSNAELSVRNLSMRKGFPESYDVRSLIQFLRDLQSGFGEVSAPVYSHRSYDIAPGQVQIVRRPDIVLIEGVNVLQDASLAATSGPAGHRRTTVSDFFDFSIYIDADEADIRSWFVHRFLVLKNAAGEDPTSFFFQWATMADDEATALAGQIWDAVNGVNLRENILPTRERATLILRKGSDHAVRDIHVRRR